MSTNQRAKRNRTLVVTPDECQQLAKQLVCLDPKEAVSPDYILDKTIHNNLFDILDCLPKSFADLIIIDPPYNLTKNYHGYTFHSTSNEHYANYLQSWLPSIVSLLKPHGSLYLCSDWKSTSIIQQVMERNLTVLNRITWQREKGRGAQRNWKNTMEDIWFGVKNGHDYYFDAESVKQKRQVRAPYRSDGQPKDWQETTSGNFRLTSPANLWDDISIPYWSMPENTNHPTQKPEKLIAKLILASCPPGGTVFDPFLGSGTTSVVAKKLGRHYCGVEINYEYACWAEKRLQLAEQNKTIQGYEDGIFWERNTRHRRYKVDPDLSTSP
jgi:site-specific DNA-methyltransferase (adenine-specific)